MTQLLMLIKRNTKLYFKDKGMFFTSLITPIILLVLYGTFLSNVYEDAFRSSLAAVPFDISDKLISGCVSGQLASSLLAVSCVTVAFCSNFLVVQDKVSGARNDLTMAPVGKSKLAFGYYLANLLSTFIVCIAATAMCFLFVYIKGWYLSTSDVIGVIADVILLMLFGSALSSIINYFLTSQGQISAVGTIISSGYGFICGAYMPIYSFSAGLQKVVSFLPGTYATSLLRNHFMGGVFGEMSEIGFPDVVIEALRDSVDCNIYFFDNKVDITTMYIVLSASVVLLVSAYIIINIAARKKRR